LLGSLKGFLDGLWELCRLFGALNKLSEMDLGLGSAWNASLHCKDPIQQLVLFKSEILQHKPKSAAHYLQHFSA
jgi:hypothetical protein